MRLKDLKLLKLLDLRGIQSFKNYSMKEAVFYGENPARNPPDFRRLRTFEAQFGAGEILQNRSLFHQSVLGEAGK
jgi:hypothetical protein